MNRILMVELPVRTGMVETGCRSAVGTGWIQLATQDVRQVACHRFGLEKPIRSDTAWINQVGILGHVKKQQMAEIPRQVDIRPSFWWICWSSGDSSEPCRILNWSEAKLCQALPRPVSLKPKLVKSGPGVQPVRKGR